MLLLLPELITPLDLESNIGVHFFNLHQQENALAMPPHVSIIHR